MSSEPVHVDFHQVRMDEKMTAKVPLKFVGEAPTVKAEGGTLVKSLDEIEVICLPADLPHEIEVDLTTLKTFDDSIAIKNLKLPKGVEATMELTATIATVAPPLTEEQLKKMEESTIGDVTAVKTEGEEKKAEEAKKESEEAAAAGKDAKPAGKDAK
jgi:large subunit ribosomal protein L25